MRMINKRLVYRIGLYGLAGLIAYGLYSRANVIPETEQEYCQKNGMVKIHGKFFKYDVYEHGEMKPIVDMLTKECNGNEMCDINRMYQYVIKMPYKESSINRTPSDVINQNGGDCDEKSFLLATLLLQKKYPCVLITTKDHAFLAIYLKNDSEIKSPASYLLIDGKKYYIAETTAMDGYIGQYNNVNIEDVEAVFDMVTKQELVFEKIGFHLIRN